MSRAECQSPGSLVAPWRGDRRAEAKGRLFRYIRQNPSGVRLAAAVRAVLNPEPGPTAEYQLARRFIREYPEFFKIDRRDGGLWVEPRSSAFTRTAVKHSARTQEGDGVRFDTRESLASFLERRDSIDSTAERGLCLGALAAYRESTEDRFVHLRRKPQRPGPENLLLPYQTRFNSPARVSDVVDRFDSAFARAADQFERAVHVCLTTDPSRFESIAEATSSLFEDVSRFKSWVSYRLDRPVPPSVVVPEFTDKGVPHVHLVLFGVSRVAHWADVSAYWSGTRDRGSVVWFDRLASRGDRWRWAGDRPDAANGRSPRTYLRKTIDSLAELAELPASAVRERADSLRSGTDTSSELWKLALYFATETRFATVSPSLKGGSGPESPGSNYEFVGCAQLREFPAHIVDSALIVSRGRPPPSRPAPEPIAPEFAIASEL